MKKLEVKRFNLISVFKTVLMVIAIPYLIILPLVLIASTAAIFFGKGAESSVSSILVILPFAIMPIIYGVIFMILALSYNWLAPKFGGLEIDVEEKDRDEFDV